MTVEVHRPTLADLKKEAPLNAAEEMLLAGCETGEMVPIGSSVPEKRLKKNTIRAGLIRYLLLGGCTDARPHPKGVQVQGAWISDELDLEGCKTLLRLGLVNCGFEQAPVLKDCELGQLWLDGSHLPGLNAQRMRVTRSVMLRNGFRATGQVDLSGSVTGGQLACEGSFDGQGGAALLGQGLEVGGSIFLSGKFNATGLVDLIGSAIRGQLNCEGGSFDGNGGAALMGHRLEVGGSVFLSGKFNAAGLVDLNGSVIRGQLNFDGSFDGNGGAALMGHGLQVRGDVFLIGEFNAAGLVDLNGSVIGGQLACEGSFDGQGGAALKGQGLEVGGGVFLRGKFNATGLVDLNGSVIKGGLSCVGGRFDGDLWLQDVQVTGPFYWRRVQGEVDRLDLTDACVSQLVDDSGSWQLIRHYHIVGFAYGALTGALDVKARLDWLEQAWNEKLPSRGWPWPVRSGEPDVDPQPYTQLARELDRIGQRRGAAEVRRVREQRLRRAAYYNGRVRVLPGLARFWLMLWGDARHGFNIFYGLVFGYGHAPMRALMASALIVGFAAVFFGATYQVGQMAPNSDVVLTSVEWLDAVQAGCTTIKTDDCTMPLRLWEAGKAYKDYETFSAFGYGFDLFIPLDALGQEAAWAPSYGRGALGAFGYWLRWLIQVLGWVITAAGAATLAGLVGRRD